MRGVRKSPTDHSCPMKNIPMWSMSHLSDICSTSLKNLFISTSIECSRSVIGKIVIELTAVWMRGVRKSLQTICVLRKTYLCDQCTTFRTFVTSLKNLFIPASIERLRSVICEIVVELQMSVKNFFQMVWWSECVNSTLHHDNKDRATVYCAVLCSMWPDGYK